MCLLCFQFFKVLAATSLRPTDLQGFSDPYCVCYLKIPDGNNGMSGGSGLPSDDRFRGQRGETYFVEKTLNPKWSGQRFIFKVSRLGHPSLFGSFLFKLSQQWSIGVVIALRTAAPAGEIQVKPARLVWHPISYQLEPKCPRAYICFN